VTNQQFIEQLQKNREALAELEKRKEERAKISGSFKLQNKTRAIQTSVDEFGYVRIETGKPISTASGFVPMFDLTFKQYKQKRKAEMAKRGNWKAR
jgi:hypothetical protein